MRRSILYVGTAILALTIAGALCYACVERVPPVVDAVAVNRPPNLFPAYIDTVIPPNIAPMNFVIQEPAETYRVRISAARGEPMQVASRKPVIRIPPGRWRDLLEANAGGQLRIDVYARPSGGRWQQFKTIANTIAADPVDPYLIYRFIKPLQHIWTDIAIRQRSLDSFRDEAIIRNGSFGEGCINCHTFHNNSTDVFSLQIRSRRFGTPMLIVRGGRIETVDTKTEVNNYSPGGYTSWHPNGRLAAISVNELSQIHHTIGEDREVFDASSDIVVYDVDSHTVRTAPGISRPHRNETWPAWSGDGRYLYFASAEKQPIERFDDIRYDLERIAYNPEDGAWGEPETLVPASKYLHSAGQPRESPDGPWLLFCLYDYGNFPIFQPSSDIYVMDTRTRQYRRMEINSDQSDSWHSWSSNGRWIAFSSKRRDGLLARVYFSYFGADGREHKPFLLPLEDPSDYDSMIETFNVPELVKEPFPVRSSDIGKAVCEPARPVKATFAGPRPAQSAAPPFGRGRESQPYP